MQVLFKSKFRRNKVQPSYCHTFALISPSGLNASSAPCIQSARILKSKAKLQMQASSPQKCLWANIDQLCSIAYFESPRLKAGWMIPPFSAAGPQALSQRETSVIARNAILHEQISNMTWITWVVACRCLPQINAGAANLADAESKMVASRHAQRFKGCRVHWCFSGLHCGSSSPSKDR